MPAAAQRCVPDVEHDAVGRQYATEQPIDARATRQSRLQQSEPFEHTQSRGLKDESRTHRLGFLESFEDLYPMAVAEQQQRRRKARRPASADGDLQRFQGEFLAGINRARTPQPPNYRLASQISPATAPTANVE